MLIKKPDPIKSSEITDPAAFLSRRTFVRGAVLAATSVGTALLYREFAQPSRASKAGEAIAGVRPAVPLQEALGPPCRTSPTTTTSTSSPRTSARWPPGRSTSSPAPGPSRWAAWRTGPGPSTIDDLHRLNPPEERVYRHRCVEGWSMVIPWVGFPLSRLLDQVQPMGSARYRRVRDPGRPQADAQHRLGPSWTGPTWRDCAWTRRMHPLTILAVGLYGETLPPQNGAPLRLVVPWKYGLQGHQVHRPDPTWWRRMPPTTWNRDSPDGVRLLFQREPASGPSALEPGHRAAHRRVRPAGDADVQRLRRPGGQPLRRHGPEGGFLNGPADAAMRASSSWWSW